MNEIYCVNEILKKNLSVIKEKGEFTPFLLSVGGSLSMNLSNSTSDVDIYVLTKDRMNCAQMLQSINIENMKFDLMFSNIYEVENKCNLYNSLDRSYPTCLYRTDAENQTFRNCKDIQRSDFIRNMAWRVLGTASVIECQEGAINEGYKILRNGLRMIDIWDAHFIRAYGNFSEYIKSRDCVLLRKYLYVLYELAMCKALICRCCKPVMDFSLLFSKEYALYDDEWLIMRARSLQEKNRSTVLEKENNQIEKDERLNLWIEKEIFLQREMMECHFKELKGRYLTLG